MKKLHRSLFLLSGAVLAFSVSAIGAEKQSFTVSAPLKVYPGLLKNASTAVLSQPEAEALVENIFPDANKGKHNNKAFMVHAVTYQSGKLTAAAQNWYTVDFDKEPLETAGDLHAKSRYSDPRIFGRPNLAVVYLHIIPGIAPTEARTQLLSDANTKTINSQLVLVPAGTDPATIHKQTVKDIASLKNLDPDNASLAGFQTRLDALTTGKAAAGETEKSLSDAVAFETEVVNLLKNGTAGGIQLVSADDGGQLVAFGGGLVRPGYTKLSTLTYGISIQSKDKAPLSNLKQIASLAFSATAMAAIPTKIPLTVTHAAFAAGGEFVTTLTTSDVVVTATYTAGTQAEATQDTQIGTQTYDNEGRYWYDFSLALPIRSYNDLTYDSTANGLTARNISKNNLFAVVDVGLPRDTKNLKFDIIPTVIYGIPISGQPLKHHMFAGSIGLNYVNFFIGDVLDQKNFYHSFSQPLTGSNVFQVWRTNMTYGINFDITPLVKILTKSTN